LFIRKRQRLQIFVFEFSAFAQRDGLSPGQLQTVLVLIRADNGQVCAAPLSQRQCVASSAGLKIERAAFFRHLDMFVNKFCEPLAPVSCDVEVVQERQFLLGFLFHQYLGRRAKS
jgi:hypothetical protein